RGQLLLYTKRPLRARPDRNPVAFPFRYCRPWFQRGMGNVIDINIFLCRDAGLTKSFPDISLRVRITRLPGVADEVVEDVLVGWLWDMFPFGIDHGQGLLCDKGIPGAYTDKIAFMHRHCPGYR